MLKKMGSCFLPKLRFYTWERVKIAASLVFTVRPEFKATQQQLYNISVDVQMHLTNTFINELTSCFNNIMLKTCDIYCINASGNVQHMTSWPNRLFILLYIVQL